MDDNKTNESLIRAYEADKERKLLREEELQAARDYLGVLLDEAQDRTEELEDKRQEADALAARLSRTESEVAALKDISVRADRQKKFTNLWMTVSGIELGVILILIVCMMFFSKDSDGKIGETGSGDEISTVTTAPQQNITEEPDTVAVNSELVEENVRHCDHDALKPFTASLRNIDGFEYLVFEDGDLSVCYRNGYDRNDMSFRKCILIENNGVRYTFPAEYNLDGDLSELCPRYTTISNVDYLAFIEGGGAGGIPTTLRLIDTSDFRMYSSKNVEALVLNLLKAEIETDGTGFSDLPYVYSLTTPKAVYRYAVSEAEFTEIQYNEYDIPEINSTFEIKAEDDGINWSAVVKLGENLYMGRISGSFVPRDTGIGVSGAKFGAFVPFNQEDEENGGIIRTYSYLPQHYVTINGAENHRYYIEINENVAKCEYYWENLNTDDKNNWQYFDADGNLASIRGIDVSKYQGKIDWKQVADAGVEFAIIRLGFRGMNEGTLETDAYFESNIQGALDNGIKVGVYFFSQAINKKEAVAEADFVLESIKRYNITYPVAFDTETVTTYDARANGLSVAERTDIALAFCDRIAKAGYVPAIYANTAYMIMGLDLERLADIEKWFAVYSSSITFPYDFSILQYSESGSIPGIGTSVDLNISFKDFSK